jgi:methionyl aminopeptidase
MVLLPLIFIYNAMSITKDHEWKGMQRVSDAVALTLAEMKKYIQPGMNARELDEYGGKMLKSFGARSAPALTYNFPGYTCISINKEVAHGIPSEKKIFKEGDLVNIDVSAELGGFWADNGSSFVLGTDINGFLPLVEASRQLLKQAIYSITSGSKVAHVGKTIEEGAKIKGYKVIRNLTGHGIGRSLHESPHDIASFYNRFNFTKFKHHAVVAIETFISTHSTYAKTLKDGWTLIGDAGGFVAQHEHTIVITKHEPIILTAKNGIWED